MHKHTTYESSYFYIRDSVHRKSRLKKSNKMQQYVDIYLLLNYCTCFGRASRPSSGINKTAVAASGIEHTMWGANFFKRDQIRMCTRGCNYSLMHSWWWARWTPETCRAIWSRLKNLVPQIVWSVPEGATTLLCTPDDGRDGCPKHVQ